MDILGSVVNSLDIWNGIDVIFGLGITNPLAFDLQLTAVQLTFLYK